MDILYIIIIYIEIFINISAMKIKSINFKILLITSLIYRR